MADVLTLKGTGEAAVLLKAHDIVDYVRRYMGNNAADYIRELIDELEDADRETERRMNSDLDAYESQLDSNRNAFNDIHDCVERLQNEIEKSRCDKMKIANMLTEIEKIITNQI